MRTALGWAPVRRSNGEPRRAGSKLSQMSEPVCTSPPIRKSPPPAQSAPVEPSPEPALLAPRSYWAISIQPLCCPFPWAWKGATVGRRQGRPGGIIDVACGDGHAPEKPGKAGRAFWPSLSPCQPRPLNPAAHAARPQCSRIEASSQLSARRKYEVCLCSRSCAGVIAVPERPQINCARRSARKRFQGTSVDAPQFPPNGLNESSILFN
jgi:hypothetical protein